MPPCQPISFMHSLEGISVGVREYCCCDMHLVATHLPPPPTTRPPSVTLSTPNDDDSHSNINNKKPAS